MSTSIPTSSVPPWQPPSSPFSRTASLLRRLVFVLVCLILLIASCVFGARLWFSHALHASLPVVEGSLPVSGLSGSVRVERNEHGVPHITASTMDDLIFAQGFTAAQDRLWQMDVLRRHGAGELAEIFGSALVPHDRLQRYLQIRAAADRAVASLDPAEHHWLDTYARGVNALIDSQAGNLPVEFRVLGYKPAPWTARDSLLIALVMAQDLSTRFPDKLNREAVMARLSPELQADLYPVGSWRDHPPAEGRPDLTVPKDFVEIPLDASQISSLRSPEHTRELAEVESILAPFVSRYRCEDCTAGSNNWVVAGAHTATGHPLLANDMHLALSIPGIWYEADLEGPNFHATGVSLPGVPFIIVGHNQHIAWGFTNSGADVQDLYVETVDHDRYKTPDGTWLPLEHAHELIQVAHGRNVDLDIALTRHGNVSTPILSPLYPKETRQISLRWNVYDPTVVRSPFALVNSAQNWAEFLDAFRNFGAPSQNVVYADDQGHIGYHLLGKIPLRGEATHASGLSPVPVTSGTYEWSGYIPFDMLPQVFDPPGGILATANSRITDENYPFAISLDWGIPYRNERIWKVLASKQKMTLDDMSALQNDTFSALDQTIAHRLAYAIDHAKAPSKRLRQAADLLRSWDGNVTIESPAPAIVAATKDALWPMLLEPHLGEAAKLYTWGEKSFVLEELIARTPAQWLPADKSDWNELLASALDKGLNQASAPSNLEKWHWGDQNRLAENHPIFGKSAWMRPIVGRNTGAPSLPLSGNISAVRSLTPDHGPSQRFTVDPYDPEHATMVIPYGQSGNPASPWYMDQFPSWYSGRPLPLPFSSTGAGSHLLTLTPK